MTCKVGNSIMTCPIGHTLSHTGQKTNRFDDLPYLTTHTHTWHAHTHALSQTHRHTQTHSHTLHTLHTPHTLHTHTHTHIGVYTHTIPSGHEMRQKYVHTNCCRGLWGAGVSGGAVRRAVEGLGTKPTCSTTPVPIHKSQIWSIKKPSGAPCCGGLWTDLRRCSLGSTAAHSPGNLFGFHGLGFRRRR